MRKLMALLAVFLIGSSASVAAQGCGTVVECAQQALSIAQRMEEQNEALIALNNKYEQQIDELQSRVSQLERILSSRTDAARLLLLDRCPDGWRELGDVGLIMVNRAYANNPFGRGGAHNGGWTWVHPKLCERR